MHSLNADDDERGKRDRSAVGWDVKDEGATLADAVVCGRVRSGERGDVMRIPVRVRLILGSSKVDPKPYEALETYVIRRAITQGSSQRRG